MYGKRSWTDLAITRLVPPAWAMATIWWLSDQPRLAKPPGFSMEVWSVIGHISMFGLLGIALWWGLGMITRLSDKERSLYAIVIATVYGVLDEYHQSFIPGRESDPLDVLADVIGATLFVFAIPRLIEKFQK